MLIEYIYNLFNKLIKPHKFHFSLELIAIKLNRSNADTILKICEEVNNQELAKIKFYYSVNSTISHPFFVRIVDFNHQSVVFV